MKKMVDVTKVITVLTLKLFGNIFRDTFMFTMVFKRNNRGMGNIEGDRK